LADLLRAVAPGLILNALLFLALAAVHFVMVGLRTPHPTLTLMAMLITGGLAYAAAFLFLPIPSISGEVLRWRSKLQGGLKMIRLAPK
jgi:hypothetical protein